MSPASRRPVGLWLLAMAVAVLVQVVLGGVTRLTDSGLSITEWKPILGVVPPTDEAGWGEAFAKYQQIPQFQRLKSHLTLEDFKVIYFWEWFHRLWGRLLGVFFVVPMVVFWRRRRLEGLEARVLGLLALGGAQGVMGWVMVASGLQELVYVSHLRLAAHFLLAAVLLGWLVWLGLGCVAGPLRGSPGPVAKGAAALLVLLFVQFAWGAFMAGLKAAAVAPTWPTINGQWLPSGLFGGGGWWWNDPLAVHLVHRTLGYGLALGVVGWWWASRRALGVPRHAPLGLVGLQVLLGALTTLNALDPARLLWLGVTHQVTGLLLMVSLVAAVFWAPRRARALTGAVPQAGALVTQP
ncbi:MAG: COX15/CtaA family protein [Myxococcaceae bacterium]|jgi:cytochrome c oxidase assembly protein subunit 15|nr:COX15/CtaA family protein [Myxococcaceae bacterium]MCA3015329.1 COX15/CtaA family protein [Myxococcaceae bacterium]